MLKAGLLEQLRKCGGNPRSRCFIQRAKSTNKSNAIERAHLIERDLPFTAINHAIHTVGKLFPGTGHRSDDDRTNRATHLVRRDDKDGSRLPHFNAHGRVERSKVNAEFFDYHVHSFSSNSFTMFCKSRKSSMSSPCSARAALICSSQPARGASEIGVADWMITWPSRTNISTSSVRPACSMTAFGRRTPREFPIRTSFAASLILGLAGLRATVVRLVDGFRGRLCSALDFIPTL